MSNGASDLSLSRRDLLKVAGATGAALACLPESAPWPLSEASLKKGSAPMKFPDFTRGGWQRLRVGA